MTALILPIHPVQANPATPKKPVPKKPYPEFPLFPHWNGTSGRWAKKIRGKLHYFGHWDDAQGALRKYLDQKDDLHAGRVPRVQGDGLTLRDLCISFLTLKKTTQEAGELTKRSYADYARTCERIAKALGSSRLVEDLHPDDFTNLRAGWAKTWGPGTIAGEVQRVRVLFKYGHDAGLIKTSMRFGPGFKRPSKKTLRLVRAARGPQMFEAAEIRRMLKAAGQPLKAMILLGINCGFGNADCGNLPKDAIDFRSAWVAFPRPKTGIDRRCPLWPETVKALKQAIAKRPDPRAPEDDRLAFITKYGQPWAKEIADNPVTKEMAKLLKLLGINGHRNFYALRHTFETVGGDSRDQVAVDFIMGHVGNDMASVYRERISDDRLQDVVAHVHKWLFGN